MPPDITTMGTRDGRSPCLEGEGGWAGARGPEVPCLEGAGPGLGVQCIVGNGHMHMKKIYPEQNTSTLIYLSQISVAFNTPIHQYVQFFLIVILFNVIKL